MPFTDRIREESHIFKYGIRLAHAIRETIESHRFHREHLVLAIEPQKLQSVIRKYQPDIFSELETSDSGSFSHIEVTSFDTESPNKSKNSSRKIRKTSESE